MLAETAKIKLLPGGIMPTKGTPYAAAWDCYSRVDYKVTTDAGKVPLGFCIEVPKGYCAMIYPRSSTGLKTKVRLANSVGIIDSDYRGEVTFLAELKDAIELSGNCNCSLEEALQAQKPVIIKAGQRICQMVIARVPEFELVQVDELTETERGDSGFGSTGKF